MGVGTAGWSSRLVSVLGARPHELDAAGIQALVGHVREDEDLDFKRDLYPRSDAGKAELAADVAAMANHRGGAIILGVDEHEAVASDVPQVELSDEEQLRMAAVVAGIAPYVECAVVPVQIEAPNRGCYVIVIPPSPARPHAAVRNDRLGYPRRFGTSRRWLSEAEVADLYRDRFRQTESDVVRVSDNLAAALSRLAEGAERDLRVTVSVVPTGATPFTVDQGRLAQLETWARRLQTPYDGLFAGINPEVRVGLRQVRLSDRNPPKHAYAELHTDGSAVAATRVFHHQYPVDSWDSEEGVEFVRVWDLVWPTLRCLKSAACHGADHAAAHGDVLIEAHVGGAGRLRLGDLQSGVLLRPDGESAELPLISRRTVSGDALYATDTQGLFAVVRLLLTDIVHAMGVAEVVQIQSDGSLERPDDDVRAWASTVGVSVV